MTRSILPGLVLVLASCGKRAPAPEGVADRDPVPPPVAPVAPTPSPRPSETSAATPGRPECPKPAVVRGRAFASGWPSLLGKRVRLRVVPLRAIGMTEWLVTAGGQRFIVVAAPDTAWISEHVFVVAGSTIAPLGGRTSLPELLLADECGT
ncbi:MAG: hypothetical protein ACLP1X_21395 [Polyangiaceae bacterium]